MQLRSACLLLLAALVATPAAATSCRRPEYDRDDGRRWFGTSERVFVGELVRTSNMPAGHATDGDVPEAIAVGSDPPSVGGYFRVEESFKGTTDPRPIRIGATLRKGHRYLVFARNEAGELRADGYCAPFALPLDGDDPLRGRARDLLAWLHALPAAGSGGEVHVDLRDDRQNPVAAELRFENPGHAFSLRTDAEGRGRIDAVPDGSYRLVTVAPAGYRYGCIPDCAALAVHDRGLDGYTLRKLPSATLHVRLVDAAGDTLALPAQFDLFREDGTRVGPLGTSSAAYEIGGDARDAERGYVVPGRYRLALVLPAFAVDGTVAKTMRVTRYFDGGHTAAEAPVLDVREGEHVAQFRLPSNLQPIRVRLRFAGDAFHPALRKIALHRLLGREAGAYAEDALYDAGQLNDGPDGLSLRLVPGQALRYSLPGYDIDGERDARVLTPAADAEIELLVRKR